VTKAVLPVSRLITLGPALHRHIASFETPPRGGSSR
jgi:hypothetical protein